MRRIYENATAVLIWVGPDAEEPIDGVEISDLVARREDQTAPKVTAYPRTCTAANMARGETGTEIGSNGNEGPQNNQQDPQTSRLSASLHSKGTGIAMRATRLDLARLSAKLAAFG